MSKIYTELSHRELCEELAAVKTMAMTEVPLGGMWKNRNSVPRADVLEVKPSYEDFIVTIYEVKRSRADFLSDIRSGKWTEYQQHSNRIYFACLKGVCHPREIPDGIGLCLRNENGWYGVKAADYFETEIPLDTMKAIMFQRVQDEWSHRRKKRIVQDVRVYGKSKKLGKRINKALQFYDRWHWQLDRLRKEGIL